MEVLGDTEEPILPITIPEAISSLLSTIRDIVRKNRTMIEYYIYPNKTPSQIEAYQPRLQVLHTRVQTLGELDVEKLTLLVDNAAALMSVFLIPIIGQLINAVVGIEDIFINHYDRGLEKKKPYEALFHTLDYRKRQLEKFQADRMRDPARRMPEQLIPAAPGPSADAVFCRYAVAFVNQRDNGKLSQILSEDLTAKEKDHLRHHGGAYLSWDCPGCAFKVRYHVVNSVMAHILSTDDIRCHSNVPEIDYRPSFLVKCHLFQRKGRSSDDEDEVIETRRPNMTGRRSSIATYTEVSKREQGGRRKSDARRTSVVAPFFLNAPRRTKSEAVTERYTPITTSNRRQESKEMIAKYGCPFCFATGKEYGHMGYAHGRDLAEHIAARHGLGQQPSSLLLEKYAIGLDGKCAQHVRKWDLNIKSR